MVTNASGINAAGQIVGVFLDGTGLHGFLNTGGVFTIDAPGAVDTDTSGINDAGQIVGFFSDATGAGHGFLLTGGVFTSIDVPGALDTKAFGINAAGQIVGPFSDGTGLHGFVATPAAVPGADTLVLVTSGLLALGAARVRSRPRQWADASGAGGGDYPRSTRTWTGVRRSTGRSGCPRS
jgi:probable HAF family extracellular repeat protein